MKLRIFFFLLLERSRLVNFTEATTWLTTLHGTEPSYEWLSGEWQPQLLSFMAAVLGALKLPSGMPPTVQKKCSFLSVFPTCFINTPCVFWI